MAESTIIPLLNAQQVSAAPLAHLANIAPEVSQALAGQMALNLLRHQTKQVQKTEPSAKFAAISEDRDSANQPGFTHQDAKRRHNPPDEDPETRQPDNPLVGNLLNLKI